MDTSVRKRLRHNESLNDVSTVGGQDQSNSLDTSFCIEALNEAIETYGAPEIFNTDQGSQFTSEDFTGVLKQHDIRISMDGKGRWVDNVFVERLWRSVKYEEVYLRAYDSIGDARASLGRYLPSTMPNVGISRLTGRRRTVCITKTPPGWQHDPRQHLSGCPIFGVHFFMPQTDTRKSCECILRS